MTHIVEEAGQPCGGAAPHIVTPANSGETPARQLPLTLDQIQAVAVEDCWDALRHHDLIAADCPEVAYWPDFLASRRDAHENYFEMYRQLGASASRATVVSGASGE